MKPSWKVAFVAPAWTAWQHRLMAGALRYADANPRILVRGLAPVKYVAAAAKELEQWGAQGLLGHMDYDDLNLFLRSLKQPLPIVNAALSKEQPGVVTIVGDFSAFVETAVAHLRQLGLRTVALLVLEEGPAIHNSLVHTFLRVARPAQAARATYVCRPPNRESIWTPEAPVTRVPAGLAQWLHRLPKPVGVLCPQLGGGGYLIRCCRTLRLAVPGEVAVVGSDDVDLSLATEPTLTSVVLPVETLGYEAMRLLAGMMAGDSPPALTVRLRCADLQVRDSTGLRQAEICDIAGALECIEKNACRRITVKQVIKQTQRVSHVTFHRRFREVAGKTPGEAIRERRLQEVRRLLTGTELPVGMISDLCGFRTPKELARAFRAAEKTTPRDYRKRHEKQIVE
jgi:LacI family transcriptional regulator